MRSLRVDAVGKSVCGRDWDAVLEIRPTEPTDVSQAVADDDRYGCTGHVLISHVVGDKAFGLDAGRSASGRPALQGVSSRAE